MTTPEERVHQILAKVKIDEDNYQYYWKTLLPFEKVQRLQTACEKAGVHPHSPFPGLPPAIWGELEVQWLEEWEKLPLQEKAEILRMYTDRHARRFARMKEDVYFLKKQNEILFGMVEQQGNKGFNISTKIVRCRQFNSAGIDVVLRLSNEGEVINVRCPIRSDCRQVCGYDSL
jgi:hypothetical protein